MRLNRVLSSLLLLAIAGCGGGGASSNDINNANNGGNVVPPVLGAGSVDNVALQLAGPQSAPIVWAAKSGDSSALTAQDKTTVLSLATELAKRYQQNQTSALADIYGDANASLMLNHTTNSSEIQVASRTVATPLVLADDGSGMAAIAQYGKGRGLAYGADVLRWIANQSGETQHTVLFTRAFNWLLTGKASGGLPTSLKYAVAGYDGNNVSKFIGRMGVQTTAVACDLTSLSNTCWQDVDLMVFGSGVKDDPSMNAQVRKYMQNGKSIVYMHPSWVDSPGGRKVLAGMGMRLGDYPGNYFAAGTGVSVGSTRTVADSLQRSNQMGGLVNSLNLLAQDKPALELSKDASSATPITQMLNELASMQGNGVNIFADQTTDLYRLLVIWADLARPDIQYGKINRDTAPGDFLRAYASDSWLMFNRASTTFSKLGQGDFMPVEAQNLAVSSIAETIEVTIPQSGGVTAIGRGAVPGKPVFIEIVDRNNASGLSIQTNYLRAFGDPLTDNVSEGYKRPRRPHSFAVPLSAQGETAFVSPFGGPLYLNYSGATAGGSITLKVRGAAKYAHFDFTKAQSDADVADAVAALKKADFGWQTAKFVGGEIQQTIFYAKQAIGTMDPKTYIVDQIKGSLFDSNHIANGYSNMPMSTSVSNVCATLGWTCDGAMHRAPGVQHFVGWIAKCGFLCSGNPSDGYAGIGGTGWGHSHELGHNTVQRVMHIEFGGKGCLVECDNNILASAHMMRQAKLLGIDTGHATDHPGLYADVVANRASGLVGDAKVLDMQKRLWDMANGQDPMRAVHFQLAFLFSKYKASEVRPSMEASLDYFTLLTKGDRLVAKAWDANNKAKYGMNRFANNTISNSDLLYVLSSKIVNGDLRLIFAMYGMTLSQTALDSVADLNLPIIPEQFYALASGKHNQLATGVWVDMSTKTPTYPR